MFVRAIIKLKSGDLENRFYDNSRNAAIAREFKYRRPLSSDNLECSHGSIIHTNMIYFEIEIIKLSQ